MALTSLQREVCRLLADQRKRSGESYIAGGIALNELIGGHRISRDIDLFHDTRDALAASWISDRERLEVLGYQVEVILERPSLVEAIVRSVSDSVRMEWNQDSAFRFFPLIEHDEFGLTLHPFDLATNKVLALVGRAEARDWVDLILAAESIQPLGYLVWAASGKDPGLSPTAIAEHASRSTRYSVDELRELHFDGAAPDASDLSRRWKRLLDSVRPVIDRLPAEHSGECVLGPEGLFRGSPDELQRALEEGQIAFHRGSIRGAFPQLAR